MQVQLTRPELEKFIDEQVNAGRFPTREAVVEAAVESMMFDVEAAELDDETAAAINRAEEQIKRGEGIDFKLFATEMRRNLTGG